MARFVVISFFFFFFQTGNNVVASELNRERLLNDILSYSNDFMTKEYLPDTSPNCVLSQGNWHSSAKYLVFAAVNRMYQYKCMLNYYLVLYFLNSFLLRLLVG